MQGMPRCGDVEPIPTSRWHMLICIQDGLMSSVGDSNITWSYSWVNKHEIISVMWHSTLNQIAEAVCGKTKYTFTAFIWICKIMCGKVNLTDLFESNWVITPSCLNKRSEMSVHGCAHGPWLLSGSEVAFHWRHAAYFILFSFFFRLLQNEN